MKFRSFIKALCTVHFISAQVVLSSAIPQETTSRISIDVDLVNVVFTVSDKKGKFVTDLKQDRFTIYEDNKRQTITHFSRETDLPLTVALLADTSGSVREQIRFEQEAATEFFHSSLRRGKDRGLILTFDSRVNLLQDYTDDPSLIAQAVKRMQSGGGTSLYDAIHLAVTKKLAGQDGRRAIILITDGEDTSSRLSAAQALEAAQRDDVAIYTISTNKTTGSRSREQAEGDKVLKKFADETGGKMFSPLKLQDLTGEFQTIAAELRAQYTLAYRPSNVQRDGTFRKIRIAIADGSYTLRARPGYFAPQPLTR